MTPKQLEDLRLAASMNRCAPVQRARQRATCRMTAAALLTARISV